MFAGSVRVITAPGLNGEAARHKRELSRSQTTRLRRSVAFEAMRISRRAQAKWLGWFH
jgi:hypothetical protein